MSNLTPAHDAALKSIREVHGRPMALVVQAVIEYKINLDLFERACIEPEPVDKFLQKKLVAMFVDQISDSVATMCGLINKSFRNDVMPLVEQVNDQAVKNSARFLQ
jgi:hypothetical protein